MDARNHSLPAPLDDHYASEPDYGYGQAARSGISIPEVLETLRRGWRYPVYGCVAGLVLAGGYLATAKVPYKSSARILIDRSVNRYLQTNKIIDQPTFDESEIASQIYVLSSDSVIVPVVRSLKLTSDGEFVSQRGLNGTTVLDGLAKLKDVIKSMVGLNVDAPTDGEANRERIAVEAVLKRLTVFREDVANVISVTFESPDPNKAANIANALADTYISSTTDAKLKSTKIVGQWLQDRAAELKTQAAEADRALQEFKVANNLAADTSSLQSNELLAGLRTQLSNARLAVAEAKERVDLIQRTDSDGVLTALSADALLNTARSGKINFALNNSDLVRLRAQLRDLTARETELEARVGPKHAAAVKLHGQIESLRTAIRAEEKRIADVYVNEYQVAKARENQLAATIAQMTGKNGLSSQAQVTLRELESSAETLRNLHNSFLQKFKEINTIQTETMPIQNARIITRAAPPLYKSSKKALAILFGSPILGLMLGCGFIMGREWLADVFRTAKAVEQVSERKCVILPKIEAKSGLIEEFVLDAPYSRFTETFRNIKALIDAMSGGHGAKVIGVVSSVPDEGKTVVAANLASLIIASSGARTLVIDSDLHLRKLTAALAPNARAGFIDALADPSRLSRIVVRRERSGLDVLPCTSSVRIPNAAELLGSSHMEALLAAARRSYDYIIIEIAPIMSVVDVKTIERFVDAFVFVVEWGNTKRSLVLDALSEADMIRDRLAGVVLNKADPVALQHMESYKGDKFRHYYQD
jgi:succinoglycan biosynthesis transport protein ExoP